MHHHEWRQLAPTMHLFDVRKHQSRECTTQETTEQIRPVLLQGWQISGHQMRGDTVHLKLILSDHLLTIDATNRLLVSQILPYQHDPIVNQVLMHRLYERTVEPLCIARAFSAEEKQPDRNLLAGPTQPIKGKPSMRRGRIRCMFMSREPGKNGKEKWFCRKRCGTEN